MKLLLSLSALAVATAFAQAPPSPGQAPAPPTPVTPPTPTPAAKPPASQGFNFLSLPPDTLIATIDGRKVTAADLQGVLRGMQPQAQRQAMQNVTPFLAQFGLLRKLTAMAEEAKLDQKSPFKEQVEYNRMVTLAQAELAEKQSQITVTPEELQKHYDGNADRYTQAKVKVIYIPFSPKPPAQPDPAKKVLTEDEAKEKAEKVLAEIRAGADFVKMVKEHSQDPTSASKDGDFGAIRKADRIPDGIKKAVFALKPGEVSEPVRQPNGFYLFRLEESGVQPFEEVKQQITNELKSARFNEWVQATQKGIEIKIEHEALLRQSAAPATASPAPATPPPAKQ